MQIGLGRAQFVGRIALGSGARGRFGQYCRALRDVLRDLPEIMASRRRFQQGRVLSDRDLLESRPLTWSGDALSVPGAGPAKAVLDSACRLWWSAIRGLL